MYTLSRNDRADIVTPIPKRVGMIDVLTEYIIDLFGHNLTANGSD